MQKNSKEKSSNTTKIWELKNSTFQQSRQTFITQWEFIQTNY
jgi:hypothetical protein